MPSFARTLLTTLLSAAVICAAYSGASAQEVSAIAKHTRWVTSLAFSNDGAMLASAGGESLQYRPGDVKL